MSTTSSGAKRPESRPGSRVTRAMRGLAVLAAVTTVLGGVMTAPANGANVTSATFVGSDGTVNVGGVVHAKQGGSLTLSVKTSDDTKCVQVTGAATLPRQTSSTAKSDWSFSLTAPAGNGVQAFTVAASPNFNANNCTGQTNSTQASYNLDNAGPVLTAALTPAANAAGWNNSDVTVRWTATDAGSGVAAAQPFLTQSVSSNGTATLAAPEQSDRLGNTGAAGLVTVRVDKALPTITAQETKNADGTTTVTFTCSDSNSGGGEGSGISTCLANGSSSNKVTVSGNTTVTGTATDKAGNTASASIQVKNVDTTAPILSGTPTTAPNGAGWYRGDVTVRWTASDPESGIPTAPADTTISGEGTGLTSTTSVSNGAGLATTATSSPAVKIDRTAPTTGISGSVNTWVNGDVTLQLTAADNLSQVASTTYAVDGGAPKSGTSVVLTTEGTHTVTYFSTDNAGNVEHVRTAEVRIDKTAPSIGHVFDPTSYEDGAWTNQNVTVTFECADQGGSGIESCTDPVSKSGEGTHTVTGTATDNAGSSTSDTATVRIDKTAPSVSGAADREANKNGWYGDDVTVTFTATDALSGLVSLTEPTTLGEGDHQQVGGTATDAAGNSASATVSGIRVDKTVPVLTASFASGWHTGDVAVDWTCTDALSGVAVQPVDDVVEGEGDNLSSSASCVDAAGNAVTETVTGIRIDRTSPTTVGAIPATPASGWFTGAVEVTLTGADNGSGVASTHYSVDGGQARTYDGPFTVTADGRHEVVFWSKDKAGNAENQGSPLSFSIDSQAPETSKVNPISPDSGWFVTSGIPFAFSAVDAHSGVAATYYSIDGGDAQTYGEPFTEDLSTGTYVVEYWSVDLAGNVEAKRDFTINVDRTAPQISGSATPAANALGWNNTDVDVTFTCSDVGSGLQTGVAGCAGDTKLVNEGASQGASGDAVDVAGNKSSAVVTGINIDKTRPTLKGVVPDANGAGWYRDDVTVTWVGDDALSGIDPATQPDATVVTGEGDNLSAGPVTISDKAGNVSDAAKVSGLKIDRTAPAVAGRATAQPNAAGWYKDAVTVDFTCTDTLSGVALCPTSKVLRNDGAAQSVGSGAAEDKAGNVHAGVTVDGINIDGTAPTTAADNQCTVTNDWCRGETANVVLTAVDQAGLSGVKAIHYRVDGGVEQVAPGSSTTVSVPLSGSGAGNVVYWAVDHAGNVEAANKVALKWDNIAPAVSHQLSPAPNAEGWNRSDVTVTFSAKDDDLGSGVASVTAPVTVPTETAGQVVTGKATDTAGNVGTDSVTVKLDKSAPTITAAVTDGTKVGDWYAGEVTVRFTCSDTLSGVATCPDPVVLTDNGTNSASGTVTDQAGNTASVRLDGIRIDREKPTLTTADVNVQGGTYVLGAVPAATCSATDSFSGLASCKVVVSGGNANGVGTFTYTATATDNVGNIITVTGGYRVIYRFDGFLQPINDTAHDQGSTSVFKAGSTVPAKFQLKRNDGSVVQAATAPAWLTPVKGSAMTAPVDESVYAASADSGSTYRYDATAQQYLYNWKTGNGGYYWRIGVKLDDGQTYFVNIGLR